MAMDIDSTEDTGDQAEPQSTTESQKMKRWFFYFSCIIHAT